MTKECIDDFLAKNESVAQDIRRIAENYSVADFVKTEKVIWEYFETGVEPEHLRMEGCMYDVRNGYFRLDIESVERRLTIEYMEFLHNILANQEDIDKVWIKFYKVDKARTREYGGNGIGLSIVKAIMESHNKPYGVINHSNGVEFWFELDAGI